MIFSHPKKEYKTHIINVSKSFNDTDHEQCALYHDFAKQSTNFQNYITLDIKNFENQDKLEKQKLKLKTTHSLESAYIYFFATENKNINFIINTCVILKHHSNLDDFKKMINSLALIEEKLNQPSKISNISSSIKNSNLDIKANILDENLMFEFIDFFEDILTNENSFQNLSNFFKFKERFSKLILADKFEAIFDQPYKDLEFLNSKICDNIIKNIHTKLSNKSNEDKPSDKLNKNYSQNIALQNIYRNNSRKTIFQNYETNKYKNKFLIKAPTGIGKTYIALELALKIAQNKPKKRIITAIPYTSIIDQTFIEYEKVIPKEISILKYHHLTQYTHDEKNSENNKNQNLTDEENQFSKKIFLADIWHENFIITTFNQLLNIFFSNSNKDNLKLETLRNSVIIIDEIQNISRILLKDISFVFNKFGEIYNIDLLLCQQLCLVLI